MKSLHIPTICACLMAIIMLPLASCRHHHEPANQVDIPVHLRIPMQGSVSRDAIGDPGDGEKWDFPTNAYIYLVTYPTKADAIAQTASKMKYYVLPFTLEPKNWEVDKVDDASGVVIYSYPNLSIGLNLDAKWARAYVVLSNMELNLQTTGFASESAIQALTFDIPDECFVSATGNPAVANTTMMESFLKNLYTSPLGVTYTDDMYMFPATWTPANKAPYLGEYYGTVLNMENVMAYLDIVCYHVAAQLDLMWNVSATAQATKKVTSMKVSNLYRKGCSLFEPAKNTNINTSYTYSHPITVNKGNETYGRAAMPVIQKGGAEAVPHFKINVGVNNVETVKPIEGATYSSDVYTTWLRGFITIN